VQHEHTHLDAEIPHRHRLPMGPDPGHWVVRARVVLGDDGYLHGRRRLAAPKRIPRAYASRGEKRNPRPPHRSPFPSLAEKRASQACFSASDGARLGSRGRMTITPLHQF
jgi:hypothetical protein